MKSIVSWLRRRAKNLKPAREGATDGLSRLPLELHYLVLEHLGPEDLVVLLNVCRSWRYIWLSDEVWQWLAMRWLPGLQEHIEDCAAHGQERGEIFRRVLVKDLLRNHGLFSFSSYHSLDLETNRVFKLSKAVPVVDGGIHQYRDIREPETDLARFARFMLYNSGRIAWWPEPYAIPYVAVIDDLRTRHRRVYSFPGHCGERAGYQVAMGDQLFIMGKERTLHVWHLGTDSHQLIELPYDFKRCLTEGDTILVIAKNSAVYLFEPGQKLRQIDMSDVYKQAPVTWGDQGDFVPGALGSHRVGLWLGNTNTAIDFIIHPTRKNVFFVVTLTDGSMTVHEVNDGKLATSYTLGNQMLSRRALELSTQLRWEKINSRGGYNLLSIYPQPTFSPNGVADLEELCHEIDCQCQRVPLGTSLVHTLVSVCFNIYTKCFHVLRHEPSSSYEPRTFHIWNDRLLCAHGVNCDTSCHVASFKGGAEARRPRCMSAIPFYSPDRASKSAETTLAKRRRRHQEEMLECGLSMINSPYCDIEYLLESKRGYSRLRPPPQNMPRLVGDDDFLVFFQDEIYSVWMFGDVAFRP
ncbi:hypothetical protein PFICI_09606 [Pestalotiopsis fici W106-1]|uniref:F-box domain-containing protein n=1 Tax=Pestalotiopsis fici (strain W106-1 / CGMCC3.15140) TaxID=1229662 RepID=W3X0X1_PESFW|nr:uncharacterized protein PFICI_09606 [Pestalotiopsis fici W106-1]ETS79753.1 hypothetical protein PFICI_09606 [Pestalotiopsis fici W106-1]